MDIGARFREYVRLDKLRREGGLTPAELHRLRVLEGFLQDHFSPGKPAGVTDQRRSVRVPTRVQVSFATEGELVGSLMTNISRHGVFVQTDHPLDIKEQFLLHIHVDRPKRDISVPVEVVSLGIGPGFSANKRGMGLRFLEADPAVMKQIEELYERSVR